MFLGQRLTGRGNPERDNSMPSKRGLAPRDPRDMVKAELPEPQFPTGAMTTPTGSARCHALRGHLVPTAQLPARE